MTAKTVSVFSLVSVLLVLATSALAHHGYAAYDMQSTKSLEGTVTNYMMANPHSQIAIDVKGADGNVECWVLEGLGAREGRGGISVQFPQGRG